MDYISSLTYQLLNYFLASMIRLKACQHLKVVDTVGRRL